VPKYGQTLTHKIIGRYGAGHVVLRPASPGTGVIAGGGVRAVLELGGVRDVLTKSIGTQNPINLVKATMDGLTRLRRPEEVAELRGLSVAQVLGVEKSNGDTGEHLSTADAEPAPGTPEAPPAAAEASVSQEVPQDSTPAATEEGSATQDAGDAPPPAAEAAGDGAPESPAAEQESPIAAEQAGAPAEQAGAPAEQTASEGKEAGSEGEKT
jgi:hypothetical protein